MESGYLNITYKLVLVNVNAILHAFKSAVFIVTCNNNEFLAVPLCLAPHDTYKFKNKFFYSISCLQGARTLNYFPTPLTS